jgi:hypothetical protein
MYKIYQSQILTVVLDQVYDNAILDAIWVLLYGI